MSIVNRLLIPPKHAEAEITAQYTVLTGSKVIIDKFTGTNTGLVPAKLSVYLPSAGQSPGDGNLIVKERNLAAGEAYTFPEITGQLLDQGGEFATFASAANAITIVASGREIMV